MPQPFVTLRLIRIVIGALLATALVSGCHGPSGTRRAKASRDPASSAGPGALAGVADSARSDSAGRGDAVPTEVAPFVGPLADAWTGDLDSMIARRVIRVLITPTRTQYWIDRGRQSGAEYELLRAFEDWLNKKYSAKRHVNTSRGLHSHFARRAHPRSPGGPRRYGRRHPHAHPRALAKVDGGGPFFRGVKEVAVTGPESRRVSIARRPRGPAGRGATVLQLLESPGAAQRAVRQRGQTADQARGGAGGPGGRRPAGDGQCRA